MKKLVSALLILLTAFNLTSCDKKVMSSEQGGQMDQMNMDTEINDEETVFNIMEVANKTKEEVEVVLGSPVEESQAEKFRYIETELDANESLKAYYVKDNLDISVLFLDGAARQIIVTHKGVDPKNFNPEDMVAQIGLERKPCTSKYNNMMRWKEVYVLYEVLVEEDINGNVSTTIITDERFR